MLMLAPVTLLKNVVALFRPFLKFLFRFCVYLLYDLGKFSVIFLGPITSSLDSQFAPKAFTATVSYPCSSVAEISL